MGGNWRPVHELILVCTKGRFVTHSNNLKTILKFKKLHHTKTTHLTEKPIDILEHIISEVDTDPITILDPFMGSGSTIKAAVNLNRKAIGIEMGHCEKKNHKYEGMEWTDVVADQLTLDR